MDEFCGETFWNSSLSWKTTEPDFTVCFQKTVLVWIPCIFLWIFAPLEIYYMVASKNRNIPWNYINILKLAIILVLVSLTGVDALALTRIVVKKLVYNVEVSMPLIKIATLVLCGGFVGLNRKHGVRTSGVQFIFWILQVICGIPEFRSEIVNITTGYYHTSYLVYYPLVVMMLFLHCFVDKRAEYSCHVTLNKPCPEEGSSFLCRIFFQWFDVMTIRGFRQSLKTKDLWSLRYEDLTTEVYNKFNRYWQEAVQKGSVNFYEYGRAAFKSGTTQIEFVSTSTKRNLSILPSLFKAFGATFLFGALLRLVQDLLAFASPLILNLLLSYIQNKGPHWQGFLYVACLFVAASVQTLTVSQYFYRMHIVGIRVCASLTSAIYRKALRISQSAKRDTSMGEIINLMQVDAQIFAELIPYINMIWSAPLQIFISLYFLWQMLGISVLAGVVVMIVLIPINGAIVKRVQIFQLSQMQNKDSRIQLISEILNGIKVLKLYGWEPGFEQRVMKTREKEIGILKKAAYLNACMALLFSLAPFLVALLTFVAFVNIDEENVLTPQRAFVSLTLFANMHFSMGVLPLVIVWMAESYISVKRLNKFMNSDELDPNNVSHDTSYETPILIKNGNFSWGENLTLNNINFKCKKSRLTAVVGRTGSGKSSLISAILGEMNKVSGYVNSIGMVAYISQQDWIQNATIQENVTFGRALDETMYDKVIDVCALRQDFETLPAGDQTKVGDKGINLSGGQKQRINIARAIYSKADIYLFDDPLSSVDSHVGKHIFENVIGPNGLLKHTTRLFVTHNLAYLPQVDDIIVLKNGEISERGTYQELLERKQEFSEFLLQYLYKAVESGNEAIEEAQPLLYNSPLSSNLLPQIPIDSEVPIQNGGEVSMRGKAEEKKQLEVDDEEKVEEGNVKLTVFWFYFKAVGGILCVATIIFHIMCQVYSVGASIWLSIWSSHENATLSERDMYLGVYGGLGLGQVLSMFLSAVTLYVGCLNASHFLHNILLHKILRAPTNTFFDITPQGRILNRFSKDIDILDNSLPMVIKGWFNCFLSVLAILFVVSYTTPIFMVVVIPIAIVYYFIQRFYIATSRQLKRLESVTRSPIYSHFGESIAGASIIRAYKESERFIKESESKVDCNQTCNYYSIVAERWLSVRLEMLGNFIILFAALFAVLDQNQNAGLVGLSIAYVLQITQSLNALVVMTSDIETNIISVERIKEYSEIVQEADRDSANVIVSETWPDYGVIVFNNFSMKYRPDLDLSLSQINCTVKGGEKVGIVGRTGAGKSSLTLSIFRLIEAFEGEIFIDGVSLSDLGLQTLRSRLTIIPQEVILFAGSLRMNLDPDDMYTDLEIWTALEQAHLKGYVEDLPNGLNHDVSEGGENLSVGQRQLLCLSRALLRKSKVLILDEATSAVDVETDNLIQQTITKQFSDSTILTIAHRLHNIIHSDRVIVLDKGCVVEFDSPSVLLQNDGSIFHSMCEEAGLL